MGKYLTSTIIAAVAFAGICIGRKTVVKSYLEKEGKTVIKSEIRHFGKDISINTLRKNCRKITSTRLKSSIRVVSSSDRKLLKQMGKLVPYGNDGINGEKWTLSQIAKRPLYPKVITNFKNYCAKNSISEESMNSILKDLGKSRRVDLPAKNDHVDFTGMGINICKLPSKEELITHLGGPKVIKGMTDKKLKAKIRQYHYDIARDAFAKKYKVTKDQASEIMGMLDHAPHEAENGLMQLVPNSVHNFKQYYGHSGLVSKRVAEIKEVIQ